MWASMSASLWGFGMVFFCFVSVISVMCVFIIFVCVCTLVIRSTLLFTLYVYIGMLFTL